MLSDISSENEEKISAMSTEEIIAEQEQLTSMLGECPTANVKHVTSLLCQLTLYEVFSEMYR